VFGGSPWTIWRREHLPDNVDDIETRVRDTYDTAYNRVSYVLRSEENSHLLGKVGVLLIGVGIGVGVGLLNRTGQW